MNITGRYIEVHFKSSDGFYVGKCEVLNDKFIILSSIDPNGLYDGKIYLEKEMFSKVVIKSKYLDFLSLICENNNEIILNNKEEIIRYAFKKNKMLSISCKKWKNIRNITILEFNNNVLVCQFINQVGEKKRVYRIPLELIDQIEFDSIQLRTYEKYLKKKVMNPKS